MTTSVGPQRTGWIPDDSTFGARLALVRQRMSWGNVKEAADACGLPVESWRRWERDGRAPRDVFDIAKKIADRVGCDYAWLLDGPRLTSVYWPTGRIDPAGPGRHEASVRNPNLTEKSARTAYPARTRPADRRPPGRPASPVPPPTHRRPAPLARHDLRNAG